jgi:hypothetical protein
MHGSRKSAAGNRVHGIERVYRCVMHLSSESRLDLTGVNLFPICSRRTPLEDPPMFDQDVRRLARHDAARRAFDAYLRTGRWIGPTSTGRRDEENRPAHAAAAMQEFVI